MKASKYDLENIPSEFRNELRHRLVALDKSNRVLEELRKHTKKLSMKCERTLQKAKLLTNAGKLELTEKKRIQ